MKYIIWGAGVGGKKCMDVLGADNIIAYIDSNEEKQGSLYFDKSVMSFETYLESYQEYFIIIAVWRVIWIRQILSQLKRYDIHQYFYIFDAPQEVYWFANTLPFGMENIVGKKLMFSKSECIAIYGVNVFSLMLYDFLLKKGYRNISLINDREEVFQKLLQKAEPQYRFLLKVEYISVDRVLLTTKKRDEITFRFANCIIEDFYDFSYQLPFYRHDSLKRFKDIHKGKRCFIIGNGPSLKMEDLQRLHDYREFSMGCNYIYKAFSRTTWRPDYYVTLDLDESNKEAVDGLKALNLPEMFVPDKYSMSYFWREERAGYNQYHTLFVGPLVDFSTEECPGFSADISKGVYNGVNVVYIMLQIAVYMGFSEIYLLGTDCGGSSDGKIKRMHFIDGYDSAGDEVFIEVLDEGYMASVYAEYQSAKQYAEKNDVLIYNATRGGGLEVFERVDFDRLFNKEL